MMLPCSFNFYAVNIMQNARLEESQAAIKVVRRNINNLRYADDTTIKAESEEVIKSLLMRVKQESEKNWLKTQHSKNEDHGIRSHHFMANTWGNNENSERLYFGGGLQIIAHGDCSHEIKKLQPAYSQKKSYDQTRQRF